MSGVGGRIATSVFVTWPDRIIQHNRVSGEKLWLGFPKVGEHCEHLSAVVGQ